MSATEDSTKKLFQKGMSPHRKQSIFTAASKAPVDSPQRTHEDSTFFNDINKLLLKGVKIAVLVIDEFGLPPTSCDDNDASCSQKQALVIVMGYHLLACVYQTVLGATKLGYHVITARDLLRTLKGFNNVSTWQNTLPSLTWHETIDAYDDKETQIESLPGFCAI